MADDALVALQGGRPNGTCIAQASLCSCACVCLLPSFRASARRSSSLMCVSRVLSRLRKRATSLSSSSSLPHPCCAFPRVRPSTPATLPQDWVSLRRKTCTCRAPEGARMRHQRPCRCPLRPERAALALWATPVHSVHTSSMVELTANDHLTIDGDAMFVVGAVR